MKKELKLSKTNTLINLANSVLKHYGLATFHESNKVFDNLFKNHKKIAIVLLDGFGKAILENYKNDVPFMYEHRYKVINSTFPPTTVAATTALQTGKYPIETGYLGWVEFFTKYNDYIETFTNSYRRDKAHKTDEIITKSILKVTTISDLLNKKYGNNFSTEVHSFSFNKGEEEANQSVVFNAFNNAIKNHTFTYCYDVEPDHTMHHEGVNNEIVRKDVINLSNHLEKLINSNKDTLFIVLSDHGMKDVEYININTIPNFVDSLEDKTINLESRFASFKIKDKQKFIKSYEENLKNYFCLYSKEEILKTHLFGYGKPCQIALDCIGDYILIAKDKYCLLDDNGQVLNGNHAGSTKEETQIYTQVYNK